MHNPYSPPTTAPELANDQGRWHIAILVTTTLSVFAFISILYPQPDPIIWRLPPDLRLLPFIAIAINVRTLAHAIRWPPGNVARHGIAFFLTALISAGVCLVPQVRDSFSRLVQDLRDGLAAGALMAGILSAVGAEVTYHLCSLISRSTLAARANLKKDEPDHAVNSTDSS